MKETKQVPRLLLVALLLCCLLGLSACRVRTATGLAPEQTEAVEALAHPAAGSGEAAGDAILGEISEIESEEETADPSDETRENPASERREYDAEADTELIPSAEEHISGAGEGDAASSASAEERARTNALSDGAERSATQTLAAEEAERMAVSEEAEEADSAFRYFTVLLQDRVGALMECKRLNVYWECPEDGLTVHKSSAEHAIILASGCYDVSARLTEERLRVDDGWIARKNPDVVVKAVAGDVLGGAVFTEAAAGRVKQALAARADWRSLPALREGKLLLLSEEVLNAPYLQLYAELALAKCAYPELLEDLDLAEALQMLSEEATGRLTEAVYSSLGTSGE